MPVPFLRLPDLVRVQVLLDFEPFDFFVFSLVSSKTKTIAALSNKKIDSLTWDFENNSLQLISDKRSSLLKVSIMGINKNLTSLKFNGETLRMLSHSSQTLYIGKTYMSEVEEKKLFEQLSDHIVDIFKVKDYSVRGNIFLHKEFVSKHTKKLKKITMYGDDLQADFPNILEEFSVDEFKIRGYLGREQQPVKFNDPLKVKVLESSGSEWLSDEALANLECQKVVLDTSHLRDLNRVIRVWKTGGLKHLEEFRVETHFPTLQELIRMSEDLRFINGNSHRIQREDGTTARIVVTLESMFYFHLVIIVEK